MWALIDNYDSFTHILHHYLLQTGAACEVFRNDEVRVADLERMNISRLIISPGPETPLQAGISMEALAHFHERIPILGICLGHQALGMFFGARLRRNPAPMHGKTSLIRHEGHPMFSGIEGRFSAMRYHSLCLTDLQYTPLEVIARAEDDDCVMAVAHKTLPLWGIQFHPESVGTPDGLKMLQNWAKL